MISEMDWYDSVVRSEIRMKHVESEVQLSGLLSSLETMHGMSEKVGDKLYKKYKRQVA
jgi:hypothetical protein